MKIDIERDWNTSIKDGSGMYPKSSLFLELRIFLKIFLAQYEKSLVQLVFKKSFFPNQHWFLVPENPSLSNLMFILLRFFIIIFRSPRIPTVRRIPVQKAPSMDDRSITELSIHDMQMVMMHPDASTSSFLSRSLSESDLSEISPIGGASGSGTQSPVQMMAPSDDDNDSTGKL